MTTGCKPWSRLDGRHIFGFERLLIQGVKQPFKRGGFMTDAQACEMAGNSFNVHCVLAIQLSMLSQMTWRWKSIPTADEHE